MRKRFIASKLSAMASAIVLFASAWTWFAARGHDATASNPESQQPAASSSTAETRRAYAARIYSYDTDDDEDDDVPAAPSSSASARSAVRSAPVARSRGS